VVAAPPAGTDGSTTKPLVCAACGCENQRDARYCRSCGAELSAAPSIEDARKVVTVVFSDLADSTAIGHALDPESLRRLMGRYYQEMRVVLERHGARVEKFIGDAVMAVFGVPIAHEDDALRASRAAVEMRTALERLNAEFEREWGVTLQARTGIHTGEVVAGGRRGERSFLVGDAVNVAARLEQAAAAGEILVSRETQRLVSRAAATEAVGDVALKGKPDPISAYRLLDVAPGAPGWTRRLDSRLVGRQPELGSLERILGEVQATSSSALVTMVGVAGVGKSRVTAEFLRTVEGRATVVEGRCLPYGEGITFWPIAEVLRDAAGVSDLDSAEDAGTKIGSLLDGDPEGRRIARRLAPLLGATDSAATIQETFWAVRKLFEHLAAERPLVVVFDDIQWGESTFLDLLEYAADWIRTAPVMILCQARPEVFEARPGWAMTRPNSTLIQLEGLTDAETTELIENLVGPAASVSDARARLAETAEGNPLFVEETLRMLVDDGLLRRLDSGWTVEGDLSAVTIPPTIQALLMARLDRLEDEERVVLERAAVVGRVFWWNAVSELCPPPLAPGLIHQLQSLARKELVRPDYADTSGEDTFRFTHILIRDVAYQGIPKADRARLHERFADWVAAEAVGRAGEYEELVGYHLEAAYSALLELGPANARTSALGRRAAAALASVGRRAFARGDRPAAVNLLERAAAPLDQGDPARVDLMLELAFALLEVGDFAHLQRVLSEMVDVVPESDVGRSTHVEILRLWMRMSTDPERWVDEAQALAAAAISTFRDVGDQRGLARGWALLGLVHIMNARFGPAEHAWRKAAAHAHRAGDRRDELESLAWVPIMICAGPAHTDVGLRQCDEVLELVSGDNKAMAGVCTAQAMFLAGLGRFDEARSLMAQAKSLLGEPALTVWLAGPVAQFAGWIELLAGEPAAAERELRFGHDTLREIGDQGWLSTVDAILAEAAYQQLRDDEAEELTNESEAAAGAEDVYSQAAWRSVRAKVLGRRGDRRAAMRLAAEATDIAAASDFLHLRWHTLMSRADVLRMTGEADERTFALAEAVRVAERKGNIVAAEQSRRVLGTAQTVQLKRSP
jgi:class 3 adenylate cyclase/tetratricopeptide (TPR) repeat protein